MSRRKGGYKRDGAGQASPPGESRAVEAAQPSSPAQDAGEGAAPISRRRKWLFRLIALAVLPALFFAVLELVLRIAGYGYPTSCFVERTVEGRQAWIANPCFSLRFFPPPLARHMDRPVIEARKQPGTVRIFVLGESAAQGDPAPAYGFSRILEKLLEERYPHRRFEVINAGLTAINSNVIYPIAQECARLEPDLFVLYFANNEMTGPYGPATVLAPFVRSSTTIRASLALRATRTGQLLEAWLRPMSGSGKLPGEWGGMEMFLDNRVRHDDPRVEATYAHFRRNVQDICHVGRRAGAKVIVCTMGVNLRDCAPFASMHRPGLSAAEMQRWEECYGRASEFQDAGRLAEALEAFQAATAIDDTFADLQFRLGRCHEAQGQFAEAAACYGRARDYDALPFRTNSRELEILRDIGSGHEADGVYLADVARTFEQESPHGVPGAELLYEHVHMNFHGNYLIARTVLAQIEKALREAGTGAELSEELCAERLAFTGIDRGTALVEILNRLEQAPFTGQLCHAENIKRVEAEIKRLGERGARAAVAEAAQSYRRALERSADDWRLREGYATYLLQACKDPAAAVEQFRLILRAVPFDWRTCHNLALSLREAGQLQEAVTWYRETLRIKPSLPEGLCGLGVTLGRIGWTEEALESLAAALNARPQFPDAHVAMSEILAKQQRSSEARAHSSQAEADTGAILMARGRTDSAIEHYRRALQGTPNAPEIHNGLGSALLAKGLIEEAEKEFTEVLRLRPDMPAAKRNLEQARARRATSAAPK